MRRLSHICALVVTAALAAVCGAKSPTAPATTTPGPCIAAPGVTCFGTNGYVEYDAGDLPLVISVPHGGSIAPATIPDRTGTTVTDSNTVELGRAIADAWRARTGRTPHIVFCLLRRTKLDANREIGEAAQGNAAAAQAWTEYHAFIDTATHQVQAQSGIGLYIDLHGHGHAIQRLELGYLLSASTLSLTDGQLDGGGYGSFSSLHLLLPRTPASFAEALRGATSLGGLLGTAVPSVPSPASPSPGSDPYFDGGYSTERHTTTLPGLQIESNVTGVRDSAAGRAAFAAALVNALARYVSIHLGITLG